MFAEEINTESDLVGENLATKGDELYFQNLPIYNKLNISSAKVGEKTAKEPQSVASFGLFWIINKFCTADIIKCLFVESPWLPGPNLADRPSVIQTK